MMKNNQKSRHCSLMLRLLCAAVLCAGLLIFAITGASACTAIYVGSEASADGTVLMAKSNDYQDNWANHVTLTERVENVQGRTMPVDNARTVFAELPRTTYRYTATPFMDSTVARVGIGHDATVCANEYGVSMIMSITAFSNKAALAADPLVEHGLSEFTAVDLVICQSATAREAVEVLCGILDTYGSSEVNIALIADQTEAWYVEMYSGHQYAAVRLPADAVSVFGNEFSLEYASDYADCILSPELETLPAANGFAVYGPDGRMNLLATYSGDEMRADYSHMRTWIGHKILAPSAYGAYDKATVYPLCFAPDRPVSLTDVMELIRNRYEGTEYSPDETGRTDMRVIGTDTALSVHILQIDPDLPADICTVTWESTGPAIYGVFVPVSNGALSISEPYARNQSAADAGIFDTNLYPYFRFKELSTFCTGPQKCEIYGAPVRAYWRAAEAIVVPRMREILTAAAAMDDPMAAREAITAWCNAVQAQAFEDAGRLLNDVRWATSRNSNTMKNGTNPETHEVLDELKPVPPLVVTLDPAVYADIL